MTRRYSNLGLTWRCWIYYWNMLERVEIWSNPRLGDLGLSQCSTNPSLPRKKRRLPGYPKKMWFWVLNPRKIWFEWEYWYNQNWKAKYQATMNRKTGDVKQWFSVFSNLWWLSMYLWGLSSPSSRMQVFYPSNDQVNKRLLCKGFNKASMDGCRKSPHLSPARESDHGRFLWAMVWV